jgi:hypothetical protein
MLAPGSTVTRPASHAPRADADRLGLGAAGSAERAVLVAVAQDAVLADHRVVADLHQPGGPDGGAEVDGDPAADLDAAARPGGELDRVPAADHPQPCTDLDAAPVVDADLPVDARV